MLSYMGLFSLGSSRPVLTFSKDPQIAEREMYAIIFYLSAFGYIDGDFSFSEKSFVRNHIRTLVEKRVEDTTEIADLRTRVEIVEKFVTHFHEVFDAIDENIRSLFTEVVAQEESLEDFVYAKLKLRSYEIFCSFSTANQQSLLDTLNELINADGQTHPAEIKFRDELSALLQCPAEVTGTDEDFTDFVHIGQPITLRARSDNHSFFQAFEQHYAADPSVLHKQASSDYRLLKQVRLQFAKQRETGQGQLAGARMVNAFDGREPFLDGHVYVHPRQPGVNYELTVLGDLHGCYSCLKAALMQSDFLAKVEAYRLSPRNNPNPKLVLLGDYIDRGRFSYNGVLRTVLQLFTLVPEHVYVLRGNHEYYVEHRGRIMGGVSPSEAMKSLVGHLPQKMFAGFKDLFDAMPNMLFFDRILFVHAGIPRDTTLQEHYVDLSSLNDPRIRFEMMWSDPSSAKRIPEPLQSSNARFPFGQMQYERFMSTIGCSMMVRGHEKTNQGFKSVYPLSKYSLLTLFSAGGRDNQDLPSESSYRSVTPMALTVRLNGAATTVTPWEIDFGRYNDPERNAFFASAPEIEHRV